jgi:hypothetical protein
MEGSRGWVSGRRAADAPRFLHGAERTGSQCCKRSEKASLITALPVAAVEAG